MTCQEKNVFIYYYWFWTHADGLWHRRDLRQRRGSSSPVQTFSPPQDDFLIKILNRRLDTYFICSDLGT